MTQSTTRFTYWSLFALAATVVLFLGAAYLAQKYEHLLTSAVASDSVAGMAAYVIVTAAAVLIAPFSTLPLMPVAAALWGWVLAALLSILGWVIGAQAAFWVARRYGAPLVERFVSLDTLHRIERQVPDENIFWMVVLLRMTMPVDVLSYALGLFSRMQSTAYFWSTLLGVTPFAFVFSYMGTLSIGIQIIAALEVGAAVFVIYLLVQRFRSHT